MQDSRQLAFDRNSYGTNGTKYWYAGEARQTIFQMRRPIPSKALDKPFLAMNELESARAWDGVSAALDADLLAEARDGKAHLLIAAAVLTLRDGQARAAYFGDDAGDGEGTAPVSHLVAQSKGKLHPGEALELELVDAALREDGSWSLTARRERAQALTSLQSIFDSAWAATKLDEARRTSRDVLVSVAVLTMEQNEKRVVFFDRELGDSEGRRSVADLIRRARRLNLLRSGESVERILLRLTRSDSGWLSGSKVDPVR